MKDNPSSPSQSSQDGSFTVSDDEQYEISEFSQHSASSNRSSSLDSATHPGSDVPTSTNPSKVDIGKYLLRESAVPYLVALFVAWFVGAFALYPAVTGVGVASNQWLHLFALNSTTPGHYWAWLTSIFTHGGLTHLVVNSLVLFFAGIALESHFGSRRFLVVFFASALAASAAQVSVVNAAGETMRLVGASGGIAGVFGALLTAEPDGEVRVFFIVPMQMWAAIPAFIILSLGAVVVWGVGAGGVAHIAHVGGLLTGVVYGVIHDPRSVSRFLDAVEESDYF